MVKEELVEGILEALSRGESMQTAMTSFYNAGYTKEDIEQAAVIASNVNFAQQAQQYQQPLPTQPIQTTQPTQQTQQPNPVQQPQPQPQTQQYQPQPQTQIQQYQPQQQAQEEQQRLIQKYQQYQIQQQAQEQYRPLPRQQAAAKPRVSTYGKSRNSGSALTIFLFFLLFVLIGVLVAVFIFRSEISNFFNGLGLGLF